jgi:HSP20 family protein
MTEQGTAARRQQSNDQESSSQRNQELSVRESQGLQTRENRGIERRSQARGNYPSIFSVTPGEFFTMSPITLMRRFTEDIDRAFGLSGSSTQVGNLERDFDWVPSVEVRQSGNNLVIHAELPGLNENDVRVEVTDDGLVIEGERKHEKEKDEGGWHRSEFSYGRFYRLIPLPENAKIDQAQANFRNGVLEVTVPVPESQTKRRQIPIGKSSQAQGQSQTQERSSAARAGG